MYKIYLRNCAAIFEEMTNQNQDPKQDNATPGTAWNAAGALNADDAAQYLPGQDGGAATIAPPYDDSEARELIETFLIDAPECDPATAKPWHDFTMTPEQAARLMAERPPAVVRFGMNQDTGKGYRVASVGELSMIVGGAKTRKTTFAASMVNELLKCDPAAMPSGGDGAAQISTDIENLRICFFDTEQGDYHAARTYSRITAGLTPEQSKRLTYITLRTESNETRLRIIVDCLLKMQPAPHLAIIDGVADLMRDTNSNTEAQQIVGLLMATTAHERKNDAPKVHIMSVLHNSAANLGKGRGHAGSELERKCETVMMLTIAKDSANTSEITPMRTRNQAFPKLYVSHNAKGGSELTADYTPPAADDFTMCSTMLECAAEANPGATWYRFDAIKKAHAAARKKLGGGDPVSDTELRRELKNFVGEGYLRADKAKGTGTPNIYAAPDDTETDNTGSDGNND